MGAMTGWPIAAIWFLFETSQRVRDPSSAPSARTEPLGEKATDSASVTAMTREVMFGLSRSRSKVVAALWATAVHIVAPVGAGSRSLALGVAIRGTLRRRVKLSRDQTMSVLSPPALTRRRLFDENF